MAPIRATEVRRAQTFRPTGISTRRIAYRWSPAQDQDIQAVHDKHSTDIQNSIHKRLTARMCQFYPAKVSPFDKNRQTRHSGTSHSEPTCRHSAGARSATGAWGASVQPGHQFPRSARAGAIPCSCIRDLAWAERVTVSLGATASLEISAKDGLAAAWAADLVLLVAVVEAAAPAGEIPMTFSLEVWDTAQNLLGKPSARTGRRLPRAEISPAGEWHTRDAE